MQSLARNGYTEAQVLAALQGRYGSRRLEFRYDLLDEDNLVVDALDNVLGAEVGYEALADVKRTLRLTLEDDPVYGIDYLRHRVKPWVRLYMPPLPVAGAIRSATTYEEAVDYATNTLLARWRFDELAGATVAVDAAGSTDLTLGATTSAGEQPLLEDQGRALGLSAASSGRAVTESAGFLSSRTAVTCCMWFEPAATGSDQVLMESTESGTWGDQLDETWSDFIAAGTWEPGAASAGVDTWGDIVDGGTWSLDTWGDPIPAPESGLTISADSTTGSITVAFYVNSTLVTASTPANSFTAERTFLAWSWVSGGELRVYLNGDLVAVADATDAVGGLQGIGGLSVGSDTFAGVVDDVLFAEGAFTDEAIRDLYVTGAAIGPAAGAAFRFVEWPQGVFLLSSPTRKVDAAGVVTRDVEGYDQAVVLQGQLTDDAYYVAAGAAYTDAIAELLDDTPGVGDYQITTSAKTLPAMRSWDAGTSHLAIVADLIAALNYEALHFDENGTAIVRPYVAPQDLAPGYAYEGNEVSVLMPGADQEFDLYRTPNRWTLVVSEADRVALDATYTNDDPASPTSTVNRGRVITDFRTEQDVADQDTLDAKVEQLAQEAAQVFEQVGFTTALMPIHQHRDVLTLAYPALGVEGRFTETAWTLPLQAGASMSHTARRVVVLNGSLT